MAGNSNERDIRQLEPSAVTSLFAGASAFSVNEASSNIVGGNMGTTVQIVFDCDRNDTLRPSRRRRELTRRTSRRSKSFDIRHTSGSELPTTVEHEPYEEPLSGDGPSNATTGLGKKASKVGFDAQQGQLEELREALRRREQEVQRRERELEERIAQWEAIRDDAERSLTPRSCVASEREKSLAAWKRELEIKEAELQEASLQIAKREEKVSELEERQVEIEESRAEAERRAKEVEEREVKIEEWKAGVERHAKEVEEMRNALQIERRTLAMRRNDLTSMEDDISSWRREELRRHLGERAPQLLKYTTIGLQKVFGRHNALGIEHVLGPLRLYKYVGKTGGLLVYLAPLYDIIGKRQMMGWPDSLKIAVAGALTALQRNRQDLHQLPADWRDAENVLTTTQQLQAVGERTEYREELEVAREIKPAELAIVCQLNALFKCDGNFETATRGIFGRIPDFVERNEGDEQRRAPKPLAEKRVLDITILWFPGRVRRHFKLSKTSIKIRTTHTQHRFGWLKRTTILSAEHVVGHTYHPQENFIKDMSEDSRRVAFEFTERLFDFL